MWAQMAGIDDRKKIFDALTVNSAKTMGLGGYGLEKGKNADLVILQARNPLEALRLKADQARRHSPRKGNCPRRAKHHRTEPRRSAGLC